MDMQTSNKRQSFGTFDILLRILFNTFIKISLHNHTVDLLIFFSATHDRYEDINEPKRPETSFGCMRPAKTQISLRIRAVWLESALSAWRNIASLATQYAHREDSDQTVRMRRLIWIFAGRTCPKVRSLTLRFNYYPWTKNWVSSEYHIPKNNMKGNYFKILNYWILWKTLIPA